MDDEYQTTLTAALERQYGGSAQVRADDDGDPMDARERGKAGEGP
jgi:hypothetical protein